MGRMVVGAFDNIAITTDADQDIWSLVAGSANKVIIHWIELYSAAVAAENLRIKLRRVSDFPAGSGVTEAKLDEDDGGITAVMRTIDLAPDSTPGDLLAAFQWDQLSPLVYQPTPEARPVMEEAGVLVLHLETALAATTNMSGWIVWEEI